VRSILRYQIVVYTALLLWLCLGWSGAHGHFCFDGQESPVSIHMDLVTDHAEHTDDEQHRDADIDLSQWVTAKLLKIELPLLLTALLLLALLITSTVSLRFFYTALSLQRLAGLRPPLRAPPVFPA
jgi:hypothetical protein